MRAGQLPIDDQVAHFRAALSRNRTLTEVLARAAAMGLPDWYLVAGCLYQTVWNVVTGQPPEAGIRAGVFADLVARGGAGDGRPALTGLAKRPSQGQGHLEFVPVRGSKAYPQRPSQGAADGTGDFDSASRGGPAPER
jgi:hypothetical protein